MSVEFFIAPLTLILVPRRVVDFTHPMKYIIRPLAKIDISSLIYVDSLPIGELISVVADKESAVPFDGDYSAVPFVAYFALVALPVELFVFLGPVCKDMHVCVVVVGAGRKTYVISEPPERSFGLW